MNKDQERIIAENVREAFSSMGLEADDEDGSLIIAHIDIGMSMLTPGFIYAAIEGQQNQLSLEIEVHPEINKSSLDNLLEAVNMANRQSIIESFFIDTDERVVHSRRVIKLVNGRLNKDELKQSIEGLINDTSFYWEQMLEAIVYGETVDDVWVNDSWFHQHCRHAH